MESGREGTALLRSAQCEANGFAPRGSPVRDPCETKQLRAKHNTIHYHARMINNNKAMHCVLFVIDYCHAIHTKKAMGVHQTETLPGQRSLLGDPDYW